MCCARRVISLAIVLILSGLFIIQLSLAARYIFRPEDNSVSIDQRDPNVNFVYEGGILVASEQNENARFVIHFDLDGWVPDADSITQADLYLYHYRGGNYTDSYTIDVYSLTSAFNESTATWNFPWTAPGGDYDSSIGNSAGVPEEWDNWVSWDVTEILKNRWGNVVNCGFLFKDPVEDTPPPDGPYVRFHSQRKDSLPYLEVKSTYLSGDANRDGQADLADVIYIANYLLKGGSSPVPRQAADVNCDAYVNLSDVIYLANYKLKGGDPPC
ncbi:MAG: hypothetical protein AMJ90_04940 [candidate division Zixibacteria bacterium SM23_73_2]|nr:MAG: hypothetical protein AMJ90_04940 [candidate division Zixibacteria bacterium SM23_73_2]